MTGQLDFGLLFGALSAGRQAFWKTSVILDSSENWTDGEGVPRSFMPTLCIGHRRVPASFEIAHFAESLVALHGLERPAELRMTADGITQATFLGCTTTTTTTTTTSSQPQISESHPFLQCGASSGATRRVSSPSSRLASSQHRRSGPRRSLPATGTQRRGERVGVLFPRDRKEKRRSISRTALRRFLAAPLWSLGPHWSVDLGAPHSELG